MVLRVWCAGERLGAARVTSRRFMALHCCSDIVPGEPLRAASEPLANDGNRSCGLDKASRQPQERLTFFLRSQ